MRAASSRVVLANPNASEASPTPVSPASVRRRTSSQTVRSDARTGSSSNPVTRSRGAASIHRGASSAPAAAPHAVRNERRPVGSIRVVGMVSQRVNAERVMLLAWPRAILLQVAHPLVAAGVAAHSSFADGGFAAVHRLWQTVQAMLALTFGDEVEQQEAIDGHPRDPPARQRRAA